MRRYFEVLIVLAQVLAVILVARVGWSQLPPVAPEFDPAAAVGMIDDASANESGPSAPFMGLAVRPDLDRLFGSASTGIPVELPPGRKVTPDLTIRYSSNAGNGPFGLGWGMALGSIRRNTARGVPIDYTNPALPYLDSNGFVLTFRGGTILLDTLVPPAQSSCGSGFSAWAASSEEVWLAACFYSAGNYWQVTDRNGVKYTYGAVAAARMGSDVSNTASAKSFSWSLTEVIDPNGNAIDVTYLAAAGTGNPYAYPEKIDYGRNTVAGYTNHVHVKLAYDDTRPDKVKNYRGGFEERVDKRVTTITIWVDPQTTETAPTKKYTLTYGTDPDTAASLLQAVAVTPRATTPATTAPPSTTFTYQTSARAVGAAAALNFNHVPSAPAYDYLQYAPDGHAQTGFTDVDGDGLAEYLDGTPSGQGLEIHSNRGGGTFTWTAPGVWTTLHDYLDGGTLDDARLVDMDGDALPDLVKGDFYTWDVHRNVLGALQATPTSWPGVPEDLWDGLPSPIAPIPAVASAQLIDLTGDGRPDILDCGIYAQTVVCSLHRNTGSGFAAGVPWAVPAANPTCPSGWCPDISPLAAQQGTDAAKQVVDVNGDGLPDLVSSLPQSGGNNWDVWLNSGKGFDAPVSWSVPALTPAAMINRQVCIINNPPTPTTCEVKRGLRDMNGDGLPDYVDVPASGNWIVYVNTGTGFKTSGVPWAGTSGLTALSARSDASSTSDVFDVNGDAIADFVRKEGTFLKARLGVDTVGGVRGRAGGLIRQQNGMGGSFDLAYVPSTDPASAGPGCVGGTNWGAPCMTNAECAGGGTCTTPSPDSSQLPFATWVVKTLMAHTGLSGTGHDLTTSFGYTNAYFDPVGHEFRGFRQCIETVPGTTRKVLRRYAPPPYYVDSSPPWYSISTTRPFKLIAEEAWTATGTATLLARTTVDWDTPLIGGRVRVVPTKRVDTTFSTSGTSSVQRTRTLGNYDTYNNPRLETVSGTSVPQTITTTAEFLAASPCFGLPTKVIVSNPTLALSHKEFSYDTRCNLTAVRPRLAPHGQSASTGSEVTTLSLEYDQTGSSPDASAAKAGQPTRILDARGFVAAPKYGTTLTYTCSNGLFPCSITNALTQATQKAYDLHWGKATSVTEPTGAVTSMVYDGLGRLLKITRPLDATPWREFAYVFGSTGTPSRIESKVREPNAGSGTRLVVGFADSLGRSLETKQQQYVNSVATVVANEAVSFDTAGRVAKRFIPFAAASGLTIYDAPSGATKGVSLAYDALDRVTQTTNPDGSYGTADHTIAGQTTLFDENYNECTTPTGKTASCPGAKSVEKRDGLGRVTTIEASEGATLKTRTTSVYDGVNRVITSTVTDTGTAKTAPTDFEYDSFGRRTKTIDPDSGPLGPSPPTARGAWTYAYDTTGNLLYQNNPKTGQHLEFCYDTLNRVSRKLYFGNDNAWAGTYCTGTPPIPYLQYAYDRPAAVPDCDSNGVGRLCVVDEHLSDFSTQTAFVYDQRGRVLKEYLLRSGFGKTGSYTRTHTWDHADRLSTVTYPTNLSNTSETLQHLYTDLGSLTQVHSSGQIYGWSTTFDVFGRLTQWKDGSALTDTLSYDTAGTNNYRLTQLKVANGATTYQQFDYALYDVASNLRTLTDNTPATQYANPSARRNSWSYLYDGLGRVKSAHLQAQPVPTPAPTTFTYDGLGNMLTGNQLTFQYTDATHPHHLTNMSLPTPNVPYDVDGGLGSRVDTDGGGADTSHAMTYDADGRVQTIVTGDGYTVRSVYDFRGQRVARIVTPPTGPQLATFHYGRWFDVTGGTLTRHMYLGNRLIADSPVTAPAGLTLAQISDAERSILLARAMRDALHLSPQLYPGYVLTATDAAKLAVLLAFVLLALGGIPGRVRVGLAVARQSPFRRLRRGHVIVLVLVFGMTLTPLTCVRPVSAGGSGGPPPPGTTFAVYFLHGDHLGSTVLLTCYKQGPTCPDRSIIRYFRYDAYGQMKAYDVNGAAVARGNELTERLYTGQRWDWQAQVYDYGARVYDPKVANFLTEDPVRVYMSPYAYVAWNAIRYVDPTGAERTVAEQRDLALSGVFVAGGAGFLVAGALVPTALVPVVGLAALGGISGGVAAFLGGGTPGMIAAGFAVGALTSPAGSAIAGLFAQGAVAVTALSGAVAGGLGGFGGNLATQVLSGQAINAGSAFVAGAIGFGLGGLGGAVGAYLALDFGAGVLAPLAGEIYAGALNAVYAHSQALVGGDALGIGGFSSGEGLGGIGSYVGLDLGGFSGGGGVPGGGGFSGAGGGLSGGGGPGANGGSQGGGPGGGGFRATYTIEYFHGPDVYGTNYDGIGVIGTLGTATSF